MIKIEDEDRVIGSDLVDYNTIITFIGLGSAGRVTKMEATLRCINTGSEKKVVSVI